MSDLGAFPNLHLSPPKSPLMSYYPGPGTHLALGFPFLSPVPIIGPFSLSNKAGLWGLYAPGPGYEACGFLMFVLAEIEYLGPVIRPSSS